MNIKIKNINYSYSNDKYPEKFDLKNINCNISKSKITAIIGESGSGKTTLIQLINSILRPNSGNIEIYDNIQDIPKTKKNSVDNNKYFHIDCKKLKKKIVQNLRKEIGIIYQFAEHQLFNDTVIKDVMFGPLNFKIKKYEAFESAKKNLEKVGISKKYYEYSPFDLSGGQKKRVAIAGVLATNSNIVIFDEPTSGLDPKGIKDINQIIFNQNKKDKKTVILISHSMDNILELADEIIVFKGNTIFKHFKKPNDFFGDKALVEKENLTLPFIYDIKQHLEKEGFTFDKAFDVRSVEEFAECLAEKVQSKKKK